MLKLLVTGGAGFIGSEFVRQGVKRGWHLVVVDNLTYAGDLRRLRQVFKQIKFYKADICSNRMEAIFKQEKFDGLVHMAAETHVDRSLTDNAPFIRTNVLGTQRLIELSLKHHLKSFIYISTDEVYGQSTKGLFKESAPLQARNPYAATKAAAECLVQSAVRSFGLPAVIIRPSNNYGPWQHPEKLIPLVISKALKGRPIPVYGKGLQIREWLHVSDCVEGIFLVLKKGKKGEAYNLGSGFEQRNIDTVRAILKIMEAKKDLVCFVADRPGHDFRYSIDSTKIRRLGFLPKLSFDEGIKGLLGA